MSSSFGIKLKVQLFGQSHSQGLGVVMDGLPAGEAIDMDEVKAFLQKRAGGRNAYSTPRGEADEPVILSGLVDGKTCGAPLCAVFENKNTRSGDYGKLRGIPRPSHADYTAFVKHGGYNDVSGGGHFSARLTLPLCFAGAVCLQILKRRGVEIAARIYSISGVKDGGLTAAAGLRHEAEQPSGFSELTRPPVVREDFPTVSEEAGLRMVEKILEASADGDSVGGVVECGIWGLPAGLGEPIFDNMESRLAYALFAIPAVKGVEFGAGFEAAGMRGSECNDPFRMADGKVITATNNAGGILGGITDGMPVTFKAAFKPTPSISKPQRSVNLVTGEDAELQIKGRHDPCVVPRAVPCVAAAAAVTVLDFCLM